MNLKLAQTKVGIRKFPLLFPKHIPTHSLTQNNEKKFSESLKVKQTKSSIKKLKKQEKEVISAKKEKRRKDFIEIQKMFDNMSKKNAAEKHKLESQGGPYLNMAKGGSLRGPQENCPLKPKLSDLDDLA